MLLFKWPQAKISYGMWITVFNFFFSGLLRSWNKQNAKNVPRTLLDEQFVIFRAHWWERNTNKLIFIPDWTHLLCLYVRQPGKTPFYMFSTLYTALKMADFLESFLSFLPKFSHSESDGFSQATTHTHHELAFKEKGQGWSDLGVELIFLSIKVQIFKSLQTKIFNMLILLLLIVFLFSFSFFFPSHIHTVEIQIYRE